MPEKRRSHWGWGWDDRFPKREARIALGQQIAAMLGFAPDEAREPTPLDTVELPSPRIEPPGELRPLSDTSRYRRTLHAYGRSFPDLVRGFRGEYAAPPDLVVRPTTTGELEAVLAWADRDGVAVIPYGGGTSVVAGTEPRVDASYPAAISLDLQGLGRVLEIDDVSRLARIEGGALGPSIEDALGSRGLTLRHFPQSFEFSTLGGWIATRSGGHFATVYTHIDEFVAGTRMLTPAGWTESRCLPGSGAGPSPDRLVCGSEGTFGVITDAWMRVRPRPQHRVRATVRFDEWSQAVAATRAIAQSGLEPSNCRLLDRREAALYAVSMSGDDLLLLGFESASVRQDGPMQAALSIAEEHGGDCPEGPVTRDDSERTADDAGAWRQAFFEAPYLFNVLVSLGMVVDTFETACTWSAFETLHAAVIASVRDTMREVCGAGFISCRFTHVYPDGPAPYFTFVAPSRHGAQREAWLEIKRAASDAILANGGTVTHHHAVGRTHREHYRAQRPERFGDVLRAVKSTHDPRNIMNPGALI